MKKKIEIAAFLIVSCVIIALAIRAGEQHRDCNRCMATAYSVR
jgi:hypothetical protein